MATLSEQPPEALDTKSRLASFEALWDEDALDDKGKLFFPRRHSESFQSRPLVRTTTFDEFDDEEEEDDEEGYSGVARFTRRGSSAVLGDEAGALLEVQLEAVHCAHEIRLLEKQIADFNTGATAGRPPSNQLSAGDDARPDEPSLPGRFGVASIAERAQQLYTKAQRCEAVLSQIELGTTPINLSLLAEINQLQEDCASLTSAGDKFSDVTKASTVQAAASPGASESTDARAAREELAAWVVELAAWAQEMAGRCSSHIAESEKRGKA
jgi:hypothetical protein